MENIIKKAWEGGYKPEKLNRKFDWDEKGVTDEFQIDPRQCVLDPLFWQALGKACEWWKVRGYDSLPSQWWAWREIWLNNALKFHEINLTEGWDKAVAWLEELISN